MGTASSQTDTQSHSIVLDDRMMTLSIMIMIVFISRDGPNPDYPPDACRVHGSVELNKVAGNFHIIAGK